METINRGFFNSQKLIEAAEEVMWLRRGDVKGRSRFRDATMARRIVIYVLRRRGWTYSQIGKLLERDHTTIISLDRSIEAYARAYPEFKAALERVAPQFL